MRTLFAALLAASALLPAAAQAQRAGQDADTNARARPERPDRPDRGEGPQRRPRADVGVRADAQAEGPRADRPERREAGRDVRAEQGADRRTPRDGAATGQQLQGGRGEHRQDFGAERGEDRRDVGAERREGRRDVGAERGGDRQDFRADRSGDRRDDEANRRDAARGRPGWQNYSAFRNDGGFDRAGEGSRRYDDRGSAWNRGWRSNDRYDWNRYRSANRGAYRLPRYYAPSGWGYGYRRFSIGVTLSAGLWDRSYWIDDPYSYRLPEAYGPYRWIRYYDDALLIDLRTGRVVDTVYDIFY